MRALIFLFYLSLLAWTVPVGVSAQFNADGEMFGVIRDSDGYVNVRESKGSSTKVVGRIPDGGMVLIVNDDGGDWLRVYHSDSAGDAVQEGFVHRSRILTFDRLPVGKSVEASDGEETEEQRAVFQVAGLQLEVETEPFAIGESSVTVVRYPSGGESVIEIDRKPFHGTDGRMPGRQYRSIVIRRGDQISEFPQEAFETLYQPNVSEDNPDVFHDPATGEIYLVAWNSDGAGGYVVMFRVVDGRYRERMVVHPF